MNANGVKILMGLPKFIAARLQLEWGEWVGIRPDGLVNRTSFNLSTRPGWERLTRDDLRVMAAGALNVSFEQIRFFYSDEDLIIDRSGQGNHSSTKRCILCTSPRSIRKCQIHVLHEPNALGTNRLSTSGRTISVSLTGNRQCDL